MEHYIISIWVPTKGWKVIKNARISSKSALRIAASFEPLEVKVICDRGDRGRQVFFGGCVCQPDHTVPAPIRSLDQIAEEEVARA